MEKIYFENKNWSSLIIFLIAILFILAGFFLKGPESSTLKIIGINTFLINMSKTYWFKNYVRYTKTSIYLKFRVFKGYKIKIRTISNVEFKKSFLLITLQNGNLFIFNTKKIHASDLISLQLVFHEHVIKPKNSQTMSLEF